MTKLERIKKEFLNWGLHEYCDLIRIINSVSAEFEPKNKEDKKNKVLETVRYLLESGLYIVQKSKVNEISFNSFDPIDETISKIDSLYKYSNTGDDDWKWLVALKLSSKGIEAARKELLSKIQSKEKIIIACCKKEQSLINITEIIKQQFDTNDIDEIAAETVETLDFLLDNKYLEANDVEIWNNNWRTLYYKDTIVVESKIKRIILGSNESENIFFNSTPSTNALVEKWKECGGRLVNKWYYYIDNDIHAT